MKLGTCWNPKIGPLTAPRVQRADFAYIVRRRRRGRESVGKDLGDTVGHFVDRPRDDVMLVIVTMIVFVIVIVLLLHLRVVVRMPVVTV